MGSEVASWERWEGSEGARWKGWRVVRWQRGTFVVLFKGVGCMVGPRLHLFVCDFSQQNQ